MPTTVRGIANKASIDKTYRFRNLFGLLTVGFLMGCWRFVNQKAAAGVDRLTARAYGANLLENLTSLVETIVSVEMGTQEIHSQAQRQIAALGDSCHRG